MIYISIVGRCPATAKSETGHSRRFWHVSGMSAHEAIPEVRFSSRSSDHLSRLQRKIAIWSRREDALTRGHHGEKHE